MARQKSRNARKPKTVDAQGAAKSEIKAANQTQLIADSITKAIVEHRLAPGAKLAEQKIADVFNVSRTLVRQALIQLSRDHLVTLEPARGARVAKPSAEEARNVFEVRSMLESSMIARATKELSTAHIKELRDHLVIEAEAIKRPDVPGRTRLLGDFHVMIAAMLGNSVLTSMLTDLVSRCSLITLMYQSEHSAEHSYEEHVAIVDSLEKRDTRAAVRLMKSHLFNVERNFQVDPRAPDLESILLSD